MKKSVLILLVLALCLGIFTGCQCSHQWQDATCNAPKTCSACGDSYIENIVPPLDTDTTEGTLVFRTDGVAYLYGADNRVVKTYTGWMTEKYLSRAPWYPERMSIKTVIIEDGISPASTDMRFMSCENLTAVVIGDGITSIGDYAFFDCKSLNTITIPAGIKLIDEGAFFQCSVLVMIYYNGTQSDWSRLPIHNTAMKTATYTWVKCTDGRIRVNNGV